MTNKYSVIVSDIQNAINTKYKDALSMEQKKQINDILNIFSDKNKCYIDVLDKLSHSVNNDQINGILDEILPLINKDNLFVLAWYIKWLPYFTDSGIYNRIFEKANLNDISNLNSQQKEMYLEIFKKPLPKDFIENNVEILSKVLISNHSYFLSKEHQRGLNVNTLFPLLLNSFKNKYKYNFNYVEINTIEKAVSTIFFSENINQSIMDEVLNEKTGLFNNFPKDKYFEEKENIVIAIINNPSCDRKIMNELFFGTEISNFSLLSKNPHLSPEIFEEIYIHLNPLLLDPAIKPFSEKELYAIITMCSVLNGIKHIPDNVQKELVDRVYTFMKIRDEMNISPHNSAVEFLEVLAPKLTNKDAIEIATNFFDINVNRAESVIKGLIESGYIEECVVDAVFRSKENKLSTPACTKNSYIGKALDNYVMLANNITMPEAFYEKVYSMLQNIDYNDKESYPAFRNLVKNIRTSQFTPVEWIEKFEKATITKDGEKRFVNPRLACLCAKHLKEQDIVLTNFAPVILGALQHNRNRSSEEKQFNMTDIMNGINKIENISEIRKELYLLAINACYSKVNINDLCDKVIKEFSENPLDVGEEVYKSSEIIVNNAKLLKQFNKDLQRYSLDIEVLLFNEHPEFHKEWLLENMLNFEQNIIVTTDGASFNADLKCANIVENIYFGEDIYNQTVDMVNKLTKKHETKIEI